MERTSGTILAPDGSIANIATVVMDAEDAQILRAYKKFLQRYQLREALYCSKCYEGNRSDGCEAYVTSGQIVIKCRCEVKFYQGFTV